ncbi:MAG TPA: hypothetical protein VKA34_14700 [Balneolales bacterium]|nr:hypothetical protein [Balneolales bacterium]
MRKSKAIILLFLLLCVKNLHAQSTDSLNNQLSKLTSKVDSLSKKIKLLRNERSEYDKQIKALRITLSKKVLKKTLEKGVPTKINFLGGSIVDKPTGPNHTITAVKPGETVTVFNFFKYPYFKVSYDSIVGFMSYASFERNEYINQIVSDYQKRQKRIMIKTNPKLSRLLKKYGKKAAHRIIAHEIWIGMTYVMAKESIGSPDKINRTTSSGEVNEQWIYPFAKYGKYKYLYFDNGKLTSWQN